MYASAKKREQRLLSGKIIISGDVCDTDSDGDSILDTVDNCPYRNNPLQTDLDG